MSTEPAPTQANGEPKVGETWQPLERCWTYGPVVIQREERYSNCSEWRARSAKGVVGVFSLEQLGTRLSSPTPVDELVVGAEYEGQAHEQSKYCGTQRGILIAESTGIPGGVRMKRTDGHLVLVELSTLKRIPDAGEAAPKCPRCGSTALNIHDDKCDGCGVTGKELRVAKARNPYPPSDDAKIAAMQSAIDAKRESRRRFTADQLNRPLSTVQTGGRYSRGVERENPNWAPAWSNPGSESDH